MDMKALTILVAIFLISAGAASAQSLNELAVTSPQSTDLTGFSSTQAPGVTAESLKAPPNPHVILKPQLGGVFVDGAKYGTIMISPSAPASYGIGQKYLSAPSSMTDLKHESGPAAHRDSGGFKLFTFEF
ncbi:MAG: hypothetical protein LV480_02140 [Methylacidiphilales bacterium]|nr:hypothetical protein [Candidatus Methylacidiphilales bacterium]